LDSLLKKYVDIPELMPAIVNEFIKKIIVYAPEKQVPSGFRRSGLSSTGRRKTA